MEKSEKKQLMIRIRGANENNLKSVDLDIPRNQFIVFTGLSGSGKSSLAFDTIYAEGQRRYMESLSSYARQFLGQMEKPDVESIEGLPPRPAHLGWKSQNLLQQCVLLDFYRANRGGYHRHPARQDEGNEERESGTVKGGKDRGI